MSASEASRTRPSLYSMSRRGDLAATPWPVASSLCKVNGGLQAVGGLLGPPRRAFALEVRVDPVHTVHRPTDVTLVRAGCLGQSVETVSRRLLAKPYGCQLGLFLRSLTRVRGTEGRLLEVNEAMLNAGLVPHYKGRPYKTMIRSVTSLDETD